MLLLGTHRATYEYVELLCGSIFIFKAMNTKQYMIHSAHPREMGSGGFFEQPTFSSKEKSENSVCEMHGYLPFRRKIQIILSEA